MKTGRDHVLVWMVAVIPLLFVLSVPLLGWLRRLFR